MTRPHEPTEKTRKLVELHATIGTPQDVISDIIGIDKKTLIKYYRAELDQSSAKATANIGGALYNKALGGDTTAMIFWMKTRAGWREKDRAEEAAPKQDINITINPIQSGTFLADD